MAVDQQGEKKLGNVSIGKNKGSTGPDGLQGQQFLYIVFS